MCCSKSYNLTQQDNFLGRMQSYRDPYSPLAKQKFTFLVPSDDAWETVRRTMGSAFKKLFMGDYYYNVRQILERHLLVGKELSVSELVEQGRDAYLDTIRGRIKITVVESGGGELLIAHILLSFFFGTLISSLSRRVH